MENSYKKFSELQYGEKGLVLCLVQSVAERQTKNGSSYVQVTLADGKSSVQVKKWGTSKAEWDALVPDQAVILAYVVCEEYNGAKNYTFAKTGYNDQMYLAGAGIPQNMINIISDNSLIVYRDDYLEHVGIKKISFIPNASDKGEEIFNKIIEMIKEVSVDGRIAKMTERILNQYKDKFIFYGAADKVHHSYPGGLADHTYDVAMIVYDCLKREPYKKICNPELAVCGAVLHDIGKCIAYETDKAGVTSFAKAGHMHEHLLEGSKIVMKEYLAHPDDYDEEETELLEHIIESHHGKREYGAIVPPAIPEAILVSQADNLSSHFEIAKEVLDNVEKGEFSDRVFTLEGASLYQK